MDANAYLTELQRIIETYQAAVGRAKGDNQRFDDADELSGAKRAQAQAVQELRALKQRVTQTEKELRASFQQASAEAGHKDHAFLSALGGRKVAGQVRADDRRRIEARKAQVLGSYKDVKLRIDDVLRQLTEVGSKLSAAIAQQRQAAAPKTTSKGAAGGGLAKQVAELAELHKSGVLSDEEFTAAKAKLLRS